MKKLTKILLSLSILCSLGITPVFAQSIETDIIQEQVIEDGEIFKAFIDNCFNDLTAFSVMDLNGNNVTDEFIDSASDYYNQGDYESILNIIENKNLEISYRVIESEEQIGSGARAITTQKASDYFYHIGYDSTGTFRKEWVTKISGSYNCNLATGTITSVSSPTLSLYSASFGSAFSPYLDDVSTSYTNNGSYVQFNNF